MFFFHNLQTAKPKTLAEAISLAQTPTGFNNLTQDSFENKLGVAEGVSLSLKNLSQASKGKSSIAARKGVDFEQDLTNRDEPEIKNEKFMATATSNVHNKTSTKLSSVTTEETPSTIENVKPKKKLNDTEQSVKSKVTGNKTVQDVIVVPLKVNLTVIKPKPKPTATTGEGDDDQKMPPIPTQKPLLGMPRKIDYIVPIVITVMAVPLLAIGAFVLYKRSRDCWDRRHYRRMDFLIDGMYND